MTVLATLGIEGESDVPFAGLLGLLGPVLGRLEELPERHRAALAGAFGIGPPAASDRLTVGAALLGLLDAAADERPVLALVDDAHWLDGASAGALLFAARRFGGERVSLLLALHDKEGLHLDLGGVDALHVPPLDRPAAASLLTRASGRDLHDGGPRTVRARPRSTSARRRSKPTSAGCSESSAYARAPSSR